MRPQGWISRTAACTRLISPSRSSIASSASSGSCGIAHLTDAAVQALPGMLLEEALARDALRAAHQGQRPADDEWRHVAPDLGVVLSQALLGDAGVGPVDPIRMGQLDRGARRRLRAAATRFADDLTGVLVLAQAAEGGMTQILVSGPATELDLGHQLRLDVADLTRRVGTRGVRRTGWTVSGCARACRRDPRPPSRCNRCRPGRHGSACRHRSSRAPGSRWLCARWWKAHSPPPRIPGAASIWT